METLRYPFIDFWLQESDKRIAEYPLMNNGGRWIAWLIIISYVYIVKILAPKLMKNRRAFNLQTLMIIYDITLIIINGYFFYQFTVRYRFGIDLNINHFERIYPNDDSINFDDDEKILLFYRFMLSKYFDMFETLIFALRKKRSQISVLHVYHHSIAPFLVHLYIQVSPCGGPGTLFPIINSLIHVFMYIYYTLSALGLRQYTWWKKYVTQLQLAQFIIFGIYGWLFLWNQKGYPRIFTYLGIVQPIIFFAMFLSFYRRAYNNQSATTMKISINNHQQKQPAKQLEEKQE